MNTLEMFCMVSGQKVNISKSYVYVSPNMEEDFVVSLANYVGMKLVTELGRHLRVPSVHSRINQATYGYLLEKMKRNLEGWKKDCFGCGELLLLTRS